MSRTVVRADKLVWAEGFGWADIARRRPATAETIYRIASISKPISPSISR